MLIIRRRVHSQLRSFVVKNICHNTRVCIRAHKLTHRHSRASTQSSTHIGALIHSLAHTKSGADTVMREHSRLPDRRLRTEPHEHTVTTDPSCVCTQQLAQQVVRAPSSRATLSRAHPFTPASTYMHIPVLVHPFANATICCATILASIN